MTASDCGRLCPRMCPSYACRTAATLARVCTGLHTNLDGGRSCPRRRSRRPPELANQYPNSFRAQNEASNFYLRTRQFPQASVHMRRLAEITADEVWARRADGIANAESREATLRQWADSTGSVHAHIALGDTEGALRRLEGLTQGQWTFPHLKPYLPGARFDALLRARGLRD